MTKHVYIYIPFSLDWNLALAAIAEGACICTEDEEHTMTPCYERARDRSDRLQVFRRIAYAAAHKYLRPWSIDDAQRPHRRQNRAQRAPYLEFHFGVPSN